MRKYIIQYPYLQECRFTRAIWTNDGCFCAAIHREVQVLEEQRKVWSVPEAHFVNIDVPARTHGGGPMAMPLTSQQIAWGRSIARE